MSDDFKIIPVTRRNGERFEFMVDARDFYWLTHFGTWHAFKCKGNAVYARTKPRCEIEALGVLGNVLMHRLIMRAGDGQDIDHKNRNTLDNRRCNLRFATPSQNTINRISPIGASGFRGVNQRPGRFVSNIQIEKRRKHLGSFRTAIEAARAYDRAAIELHGEFAVLNFPNDLAKAG